MSNDKQEIIQGSIDCKINMSLRGKDVVAIQQIQGMTRLEKEVDAIVYAIHVTRDILNLFLQGDIYIKRKDGIEEKLTFQVPKGMKTKKTKKVAGKRKTTAKRKTKKKASRKKGGR